MSATTPSAEIERAPNTRALASLPGHEVSTFMGSLGKGLGTGTLVGVMPYGTGPQGASMNVFPHPARRILQFTIDTGSGWTGTLDVEDLRPLLTGTSLIAIKYDNVLTSPFEAADTRMAALRALAPDLSLRQWAEIFGVSKQAIRDWSASEPPKRAELDSALKAFREAAIRQPHLSRWLQTHLPGSEWTPLRLAAAGRWRALQSASRLLAPVGLGTTPTSEIKKEVRDRRSLSKRLGGADAPPAPDDEDE